MTGFWICSDSFGGNLQIAVESVSEGDGRPDFTEMLVRDRSFPRCEDILVRYLLILVFLVQIFNPTVLRV